MQLVSLDSPVELRQAAAVNFKNFVKYHWVEPILALKDTPSLALLCKQEAYAPFGLQAPNEDADLRITDGEKVLCVNVLPEFAHLRFELTVSANDIGSSQGPYHKPYAQHTSACPGAAQRGLNHHWRARLSSKVANSATRAT